MRARSLLVPAFALLAVLSLGAQTPQRLTVIVLDENGVAVGSGRRESKTGRGKWVDLRSGEEAIPTGDEPDPAQGSRTLN